MLSSAIDRYVYVTVKRHSELFFEPVRINYSTSEQVDRIDQIENNIARECLRFLDIEPPIYVSHRRRRARVDRPRRVERVHGWAAERPAPLPRRAGVGRPARRGGVVT